MSGYQLAENVSLAGRNTFHLQVRAAMMADVTRAESLPELMKDGLIYRDRGKGTFVTDGAGLKQLSLRGTIENPFHKSKAVWAVPSVDALSTKITSHGNIVGTCCCFKCCNVCGKRAELLWQQTIMLTP